MLDTIDFVRDIIKQRSDSRTPLERQVVDLLRTMIHARLTEHPAFDALYQLYGYLTVPGELERELRQHRTWEGELVDGIDMVAADKHYRHWCKLRGVERASMSRRDGRKPDAPCLVYVASKLGVRPSRLHAAWQSRKKLTT